MRFKQVVDQRSGSLYAVSVVELELFNSLFSHFVLEYLTGSIHREAVNEVNVSWALMLSHTSEAEVLDLLFGSGFAVLEDDAGHDLLTVVLIRNADDLNVLNLGVGIEEVLDLLGVDIFAAADDPVLDTSGDRVVTVFRSLEG